MYTYRLTSANNLERIETPSPAPEEGKIKIRVTKVLIGNLDASIYSGDLKVRKPLIPGRFAVGMVAENTPIYPKNTRVLLHTYVPMPDKGTEKKDFSLDEIATRGRTRDGFLRDFVMLSPSEFTPLPDSVPDEKALLVHHIALAKEAVDKLSAQKGDHVVVVGANMLGIFISQLLIYQQSAPILVDGDPARLDFARRCGIYYTMLDDESLLDNVASVTGGRLANGAIYVTEASSVSDWTIPFALCAREKRVVYAGTNTRADLNLDVAMRKELTICGVPNGKDCLEMAINLLVSDGVDLTSFVAVKTRVEEASALLKDFTSHFEHDLSEINFLTLI